MYLFGGEVPNESADIIEVFDGTKRVLTALKDIFGAVVKIPNLTALLLSCSVALEEQNSIIVTGGIKHTV